MKILLHACCGPCSCYPVKSLREKGIEPTLYFFNPNIHPYMEWQRRLEAIKDYAKQAEVELITDEHYIIREFLKPAMKMEDEDGVRCDFCYAWRIKNAAIYAKQNGYDTFSTTLLYSIYQDHDMLKFVCDLFAKKFGVDFYYEDFREGWQAGIDESVERNLYRQPYCGCIFSEEERYSKELRKKRKKENKAKKQARLAVEGSTAVES